MLHNLGLLETFSQTAVARLPPMWISSHVDIAAATSVLVAVAAGRSQRVGARVQASCPRNGVMSEKRAITVTVNGTSYTKEVPVRLTLADFIRHELNLTGTHLGCEHGVCGACTILFDGRSARSCLMLAV